MTSSHVRRILAMLLLVASAAAGPAAGQRGSTLFGTVVDAETDLPLPGAMVRVGPLGRSAITGQSGRFVLTGIAPGAYEVEVAYMGYRASNQRVSTTAGASTRADFRLQPGVLDVAGVVVVGRRSGQASALNQQLTSPNITSIVAADQIGRFPDANIGDALKRIPGINVTVDQGEARFGLIRGTEPRLNSVMINGNRIPSAEAEVREVQLDLIPADMVSAVEVSKALTPDMDADAIGGAVNIVTRSAPTGRRITTTLGSGYNFLSEEPMGIASGVLSDRFLDGRLGVVVSGSYFNHHLGSDDIEAVWAETDGGQAFVEEFDVRAYQIQRVRRSLAASLDYQLSPASTLTWRSMYNWRDDWENRFRLTYVLDEPDAAGMQETELRRETKGGIGNDRVRNARLEDQRIQTHSLSGEHYLGGVELSWSGGYAVASESRPNERYIAWRAREVPVAADLSNPRKPAFSAAPGLVTPDRFTLRALEEERGWTRDEDFSGRFDLTIPLAKARESSSLSFGGRMRLKDKLRDNRFGEGEPVAGWASLAATDIADYSDPGFIPGAYSVGTFTTPAFLGDLDLGNAASFEFEDVPTEYMPGNYDARERITAGYAMLSQRLGERLTAIVGLRAENTDIDYDGYELNADTDDIRPTSGNDNYTNLLPGIHLRYELGSRTIVRAAWSNTLSRPNYYDLVPYRIVSLEDDELEVGNPDLNPTTSMNFDLMAERYFLSVGLLSGGVFYKDINDFIFSYSLHDETDSASGRTFSTITRPQNGANADLWGFEVAVQRQLDFLPGPLAGLGIYTNYTFTDSRVDGLNIDGREEEELPLPGTARHTGNVSLSYDDRRVSLRGSVNYQDTFIDPGELGESAFHDRHYDRTVNVDLNASLTVTPTVRLFVEANNLTNQPLRYFQGVRERVMQEEFYDRRFSLGMKYDL